MRELCAACLIEVDSDTKVCPICMEPVGTIIEKECPHGGDNEDCESCAYYPDFEWDAEEQDCMKR